MVMMTVVIIVTMMMKIFVLLLLRRPHKFSKNFKLGSDKRLIRSKFHTHNTQILGDALQNLIALTPGICKVKVKCTLVQALSSVQTVRPIGGVEVYLYSFMINGTRRG